MIKKELIDAGLIQYYPVVVLTDDQNIEEPDQVILDAPDYTHLRINEGMSDREIMVFAGVI
jgi:hypothetical protein